MGAFSLDQIREDLLDKETDDILDFVFGRICTAIVLEDSTWGEKDGRFYFQTTETWVFLLKHVAKTCMFMLKFYCVVPVLDLAYRISFLRSATCKELVNRR